MPVSYVNGNLVAYDYEAVTVSSTAVGLTATKVHTADTTHTFGTGTRAKEVLITVETQAIRWRIDGTDPTATEGHQLSAGDSLTLSGHQNISKLRMIRVTTDATVRVTFFRG